MGHCGHVPRQAAFVSWKVPSGGFFSRGASAIDVVEASGSGPNPVGHSMHGVSAQLTLLP